MPVCQGLWYLEVFEIDGVGIQSGEEEVIPLGDHANLLSLLQDLTEGLLTAVQHDEDWLAQVDLLQHLQRE